MLDSFGPGSREIPLGIKEIPVFPFGFLIQLFLVIGKLVFQEDDPI